MKNRMLLLLGGLCAAVLTVAAPSALAGQGFGLCQLDGTAKFSTGLNTTAKAFTYSFTGTLSGCQGSPSGPKAGSVSAGAPITIGGVAFKPIDSPAGNGSCTSSDTWGTAFIAWDNGTYSVAPYTTTGYAAAVALTGTFNTGSVVLNSVEMANGKPKYTIAVPLAYGGDYTGGPLAFEPPDPTACNTPGGVTTAGIGGALGHGNYM